MYKKVIITTKKCMEMIVNKLKQKNMLENCEFSIKQKNFKKIISSSLFKYLKLAKKYQS